MIAKINSFGLIGIDGYKVLVESDLQTRALPTFDIVGLPDATIKESKDRIRSAIKNSGFEFPNGKITVNLAPADVKKQGSIYDLPILLALLKSSGVLNVSTDDSAFIGELSLSGDLRYIDGILPMVIEAKNQGFKKIYLPDDNIIEASIIDGIDVFPIKSLNELISHLEDKKSIKAVKTDFNSKVEQVKYDFDFSDVKGQQSAKRALEIAAAGGHNAIMIGPPGSGKSMLAKRLISILPKMTFEESIETTKIYSIVQLLDKNTPLITQRPFRAPHHNASAVSLSGGGQYPKPGEISLAHNGVLFLDEIAEFSRSSLEVMRQPMEDNEITISRSKMTLTYPCNIMVIAAMNPCPCGFFSHPSKKCICSAKTVSKYISKISGPLLDRIDLHIDVAPVKYAELTGKKIEESSEDIRNRINKSRDIQNKRYKDTKIKNNANITPNLIRKYCKMDDMANNLLKKAFDNLSLSARAYDKILKIARTIADLKSDEIINAIHVSEALQYRTLDRKYWVI